MKPLALLLLGAALAFPHRLDEYLQAVIFTVAQGRVEAEMTLTPGVAVFPVLVREIDADGDGVLTAEEQRGYVQQILRDISLRVDGTQLLPEVKAATFPPVEEMKNGRGEIVITFAAGLPRGGARRKITFENHHHSRIAAYQVNALVPRDPAVRITAQKRNDNQSSYELDYEQAGVMPSYELDKIAAGFLLLSGITAFRHYLGRRKLLRKTMGNAMLRHAE